MRWKNDVIYWLGRFRGKARAGNECRMEREHGGVSQNLAGTF